MAHARRSATWVRALVLVVGLSAASAARGADVEGLRIDGERFRFDDGKLSFTGVLVKPEGKGPFPAVLISHGLGGSGEQFGLTKGRAFAKWGFVCIAPTYTHTSPQGDRATFGASPENLKRATKCLDILVAQPEVDAGRLCAFGNSMGAFLTIGLAAAEPGRLVAVVITAGGVAPAAGHPAPPREQADKIRTPFLILHGDQDTTVPPERSALLADVLKENKVEHERVLYPGAGHNLHAGPTAADVNGRIEAWVRKHTARTPKP